MKHTLAACLALTCLTAPAFAGPAEDYTALREDVWNWQLDREPTLAMQIGDRRGDGKLSDNSLAAYEAGIRDAEDFLLRLSEIDPSELPAGLGVDYAILERSLSEQIEAASFAQDRYIVITNRWGPHETLMSLPYSSPFFSLAYFDSYLGRLSAFPGYADNAISRSREAIRLGLTQPCGPMDGYEDSIRGMISDTPETSALWAPFEAQPATITDEDWSALTARARSVISDAANPALEAFAAFYAGEYAPNCRSGSPGISGTPDGGDYYEFLVRHFTTTDMTADEIHELGLSEVARIRAEMETVAAEAGFESREAFIAHLRTDPKYFPETPEALMLEAAALAKEIDGWMPKLFGQLPRLPYTVLPIPAASAPGNTTAYYEPGSLAAGQPGIYRVNTTELDQRPLWELPALGVHEAVPGHHHQIALQQELDMHPIRQFGTFFTAFVEGWGLYSERLGIEMGLYDTPARDMGRLSYEMWRAARLVVDTGLHAEGWSKAQAVAYMRDNTALSDANIDAEVNRYITWPGQAVAYKIGELKIRELRARAETELGARFDLRAFHDAVLENGAIPMDVLEAHILDWIDDQAG